MKNDWNDVIEREIASLSGYRTANHWFLCKRTWNDSPSSSDSKPPEMQEDWKPVEFPIELTEKAEFWFRLNYTIPKEIHGIPVSGSRTVLQSRSLKPMEVFLDGKSIFSARYWSDLCVPEAVLTEKAETGRTCEILVRVDNTGSNGINDRIEIAIEIERIEELLFELETFIQEIPFCDCITQTLAPKQRPLFDEAVRVAEREIGDGTDHAPMDVMEVIGEIRRMLAPLADSSKSLTVHLIGHAHIDMNWLWTMEDTIDVCERDFGTMVRFMEEFPDFCFSQSQAAVYDIMESHFPELFERIQRRVTERQWEVTAATWTEGDLNMASGEATIRQILLARRYCENKLNATSRVCWEPDTFGHPATLPQILKKCGISYYYHMRCGRAGPLYLWEGPDGSEILVFNSVYNNSVNAADIATVSRTLLEEHALRDALFVYGVGDHGGGATRRDIRRAVSLNTLPTMPRVVLSTAHRFFDAVANKDLSTLPRITGELNPIFDGCYTSHANLKHLMRGCENRLLELEAAGVLADLFETGRGSPQKFDLSNAGSTEQSLPTTQSLPILQSVSTLQSLSTLESLWRSVLFNQFHDIFCGCSIHATYERAEPQLRRVIDACATITRENLSLVSEKISSPWMRRSGSPTSSGQSFAIWNLQGHTRTDIVTIEKPNGWSNVTVADRRGERVPGQIFDGKVYFVAKDVPPFGFREYTLLPIADPENPSPQAGESTGRDAGEVVSLESDYYRITVDGESGCITHLEEIKSGKTFVSVKVWVERIPNYNNLFSVEYEMPHGLSAWIIGAISRKENLTRGAKVAIASKGPVMAVISVQHRLGQSTIDQSIFFYQGLKRIDFKTIVDWNEVSGPDRDAPLLRVSFKPELAGISRVRYDIPFGFVERNADGTEYPGQKWVDVSDDQSGMSLINDGRYGFCCTGNTLSMTCVRTSYAPDPEPDKGRHTFGYALYPHSGNPVSAGTPEEAAGFNSPLIPIVLGQRRSPSEGAPSEQPPVPSSPEGNEFSLISVEGQGIIVSSLKGDTAGGGVILRVYEAEGREKNFTVDTALMLKRVEEISPTEDRVFAELPIYENGAGFDDRIGRYEIKTYRLAASVSRATDGPAQS